MQNKISDADLLYYNEPAHVWNEALPIGNGRLGAMVFGDPVTDALALNLDELWTGYPRDAAGNNARAAVDDAARAAMAGDDLRATAIIRDNLSRINAEAYMPLGTLRINMGDGEISCYSRKLTLQDAVVRTSYRKNGVRYKTEVFASHPHAVIVYHVEADTPKALSLSVSFTSDMKHTVSPEDDKLCLDGECIANSEYNRKMFEDRNFFYSDEPEKRGISYRCAVSAVTDGTVTCNGDTLSVTDAQTATLYIAAESSFNGFDKHPHLEGKPYTPAVSERLSRATKEEYEALRAAHIADFASYYDRVTLSLDSDGKENVPTEKRLLSYHQNGGKGDNALPVLLYNFGRYLAISASRDDSQPMNLQGIWNDTTLPPWHSNFTLNINTEMNYWPILMCNMPELHEPLIKMIEELSVTGEEVARRIYGARGFVVHHNSDLWRNACPSTVDPRWMYWPMASGWLVRHLFEHYLYTGDLDFLRNRAYPVMKKAALFYLDMLSEDKNGYLIMSPSTSPENSFYRDGGEASVAATSAMTMSIIRDLFGSCVRTADILSLPEDDFTIAVKAALPRLLPMRVSSRGDLIEWYNEEKYVEEKHRHVSHLYALHPAHEITKEKAPALFAAAKKTLDFRGDAGTGWSLGWKINFHARLGDGDRALRLIKMQLTPLNGTEVDYDRAGGTYPNLFDAHPPFQIDGNFGAVSGITEMLVSGDGENTYLLPALPSEWKNGSLKGIRIYGGATVDLSWQDGRLTDYRVHGTPMGKIYYHEKELAIN